MQRKGLKGDGGVFGLGEKRHKPRVKKLLEREQ